MADIPDFRTRTPSIDPMAFANVLQRKAQIEQEQRNVEEDRKDKRIKGLIDAVVTGQNIANNMMTMAEKRNKMAQTKREQEAQNNIANLVSQPTEIPSGEASLDPKVNAQRMAELNLAKQRELARNLALSGSADEFNKALINQNLGTDETSGDTEIRSLLNPKTNQVVDYVVNKKLKKVTTIGGTPVPKDVADKLLRGYAPKEMKDQFGNPIIVPNLPGEQPNSNTAEVIKEGGIPALQATAPVLAERFTAARDKAFPANNQQLKEAVDSAASAGIVSEILTQKEVNEVGLKSLGFHLARMSGSNSQLSDSERQIFEQPLALLEKAKNYGYKNIKGDLSPKMKQDLTALAKLIARKEQIRGHKAILAAKQAAKGQVGKSRWDKFNLEQEFPTIHDLTAQSIDYEGEVGSDVNAAIEDFFNNPTGK